MHTINNAKAINKENLASSAEPIGQQLWSIAFCMIVLGTVVANIGTGLEANFGVSQQAISSVCKIIIVLSIVPGMLTSLNRDITAVMGVVFTAVLVTTFQLLLFPQLNTWFIETVESFLSQCLPMMLCLIMLDDYDTLVRYLVNTSIIVSVILLFLLVGFGGDFFSGYSMGFSNALILPANSLFLNAHNAKKQSFYRLACFVCGLICSFTIAAYGSRGSLAAIACFLVLQVFIANRSNRSGALRRLAFSICIVLVAFFVNDLAQAADTLLSSMGFHSRTLSLLSGSAIHDSGRIELWSKTWNDVTKDPLAFRGICSDYALLGMYCHSIVLTLLHNLGCFFGSIALVFILFLSLETIRQPYSSRAGVSILLFCSCFPLLLWSGCFWENNYFWSWLLIQAGITAGEGRVRSHPQVVNTTIEKRLTE